MKKITPMKKLSPIMDEIKSQLQYQFDIITLNKTKAKYNPIDYQYSKGVDSDFIIIFRFKALHKLKENLSFAFSFDYKNREENKEIMQVTIKYGQENNKIYPSSELDFTTFKDELKKFNKELKDMEKININVIDKVKEIFHIEPQKKQKEIQDFLNNLQNKLKEKKKELQLENLEKELQESQKDYVNCFTIIEKEIKESEEQKNIVRLEKELIIAQKNLEILKEKIAKKYNIKEIKENFKRKDKKVEEVKKILQNYEEEQIKSLNQISQKKVLKLKNI